MDLFNYLSSFKTVAPIEATNKGHLALEIEPGEKYLVDFGGGKKYYLAVSKESIKPMFNNEYHGVLLAITKPDDGREIWIGRLYVRGSAVVLCNKPGERFIVNCGDGSDYFYTNSLHEEEEREMPTEDYLDILSRHFKKIYFECWAEEPEFWQKGFNGILQRVRPLEYKEGILHIV